jgi:hypothetical protein
MPYINSDGTDAVKDMGEIGVEDDGSPQGVQAISLKEGLGRRANRLGGGTQGNSGTTGVAIGNAGLTQVCQTALAGAGNRQHLVAVSLLALGGTAGVDFTVFQITFPMDDGTRVHTVYLPVGGYANLILDAGAACTAQNGQVTVSARGSAASGQSAFAGLLALNLPG